MRFDSIHARGLGVFKEELAIDFSTLPGVLTGVVGLNGAGKSSFCELLFASLYRDTPTRGSLIDLATDRDAFLEVKCTNGSTRTLRHTIDGVSKKSEALILDDTGAPVLSTTSVRAFDEWALAHLPSQNVMLSSVFAAQQEGGFIGQSPRERKATLSRLLGIEELETFATRAREKANGLRSQLTDVGGQLRALGDVDPGEIGTRLVVAHQSATAADYALSVGRSTHDAALAYRAKAAQRITDQATLVDLQKRIANNRSVLVDAPAMRHAVERFGLVRAELVQLRADAELSTRDANDARRRQREHSDQARRAQEAGADARRRIEAAKGRLALRDQVTIANRDIKPAKEKVVELERQNATLEREQEALRETMLGGATRRIVVLRIGLEKIALDAPKDPAAIAYVTLKTDETVEQDQKRAPADLEASRGRITDTRFELTDAREALSKLEWLIAKSGEIEAAQAEIDAATTALNSAITADEKATRDALAAGGEYEACVAASSGRNADLMRLEDEEKALAPVARKAEPLATAEARLSELEPQAQALRDRITAIDAEVASLPAPVDVSISDLEGRAREAHALVGRLEGDLHRAKESAERREALTLEQRRLETELADWTLLAEDLGTTGLPALLIDAAGPELTELVNDLLHTCLGPRFTVTIDTTKTSADGKKQIETCDVRVLDTEKGREDRVETFSGGERACLQEAVSLALSMLACRRSGIEGPSIIRDETGAALDEANALAYVRMLRRAAEIVGASRVLVISHNPDVIAQCDSRLIVEGGTVRVGL